MCRLGQHVSGRSEQRAFFIPTQLCSDFTLGSTRTLSPRNNAQGIHLQQIKPLYRAYRFQFIPEHVSGRLPWTNASSLGLTSFNVEPARPNRGVKSMGGVTR
jgi:hypothetical protein